MVYELSINQVIKWSVITILTNDVIFTIQLVNILSLKLIDIPVKRDLTH